MGKLADEIERYIQKLLRQAGEGAILLRRNDLAAKLQCVPSQISYVLATRFTSERGYIVESRRGSGGYVRIWRAGTYMTPGRPAEQVGAKIDARGMLRLLDEWQRETLLSRREKEIIRLVLDGHHLSLDDDKRAYLLKILLSMLGE